MNWRRFQNLTNDYLNHLNKTNKLFNNNRLNHRLMKLNSVF